MESGKYVHIRSSILWCPSCTIPLQEQSVAASIPLREILVFIDNLALFRDFTYSHHSAVQSWSHLRKLPIAAFAPTVSAQLDVVEVE